MLYPTDPLEAVVEAKMAHHKPICATMGWLVAVFADPNGPQRKPNLLTNIRSSLPCVFPRDRCCPFG